jgi:AcrR family transcriptional regulator
VEASPQQAATSGRERVLATAYDLFSRYGTRAVGVDRIISESGVAKMTLYRNFASKDDLILAFLDRREVAPVGGRAAGHDAGRAAAGDLRHVRRVVRHRRLRGLLVHQRDARAAGARSPGP